MLITFSSKSYANITMFDDIAMTLIKAMGQSGAVPSAITTDYLPEALNKLNKFLETQDDDVMTGNNDTEEEVTVSMHHRAFTLIEMIQSAIENNADIYWEHKN